MLVKNLIVGCIFLALAGNATSSDALPSGVMEGHLKILSSKPVDVGDENAATVTPGNYPNYPLSGDRQKEIARMTADENGNYRVALPPGAYVPDLEGRTQGHTRGHIRAKPQRFTVASDQTVRVDVTIDRDHWRARSPQSFRPD